MNVCRGAYKGGEVKVRVSVNMQVQVDVKCVRGNRVEGGSRSSNDKNENG